MCVSLCVCVRVCVYAAVLTLLLPSGRWPPDPPSLFPLFQPWNPNPTWNPPPPPPCRQVIVAGRPDAADTSALLDAVHGPFCPDKVDGGVCVCMRVCMCVCV